MNLKLATVEELRPEANEVVGRLRDAGHVVTVISGPESAWTIAQIHESLREGAIDLGLVPGGAQAEAVEAAAVLGRGEPRDVVVSGKSECSTLAGLPSGATIGVAGARRRGLLSAHRPDLDALDLANGQAPALLLEAGTVDAMILGSSEARRGGLSELTRESLDPKAWMPEPCQDTLVVIARSGDPSTRPVASVLDDEASRRSWLCETALAAALGAGPEAPLGALALPFGRWIRLWATVISVDGSRMVRADLTRSADDPEGLGRAVADLLLVRGAGTILGGETS